MRWLISLALLAALSACASEPKRDAALTTAAVTIDPIALGQANAAYGDSYRIGATDLLKVTTFQVADLSFDEIRVDANGDIQMPLIGTIRAAGLSPEQLADEMERRLAARYLQNPQVNVTVSEAASQKVTVDGSVTKPGVYEMRGRTTLLQAVSMAEGPLRTADLKSVAVFRQIDGRRAVAVFDLGAIRNGRAEDPVLLGDDIVIVDSSRLSVVFRDALAALPSFAVFGYF